MSEKKENVVGEIGNQGNSGGKRKYIVMDVVFYASSLNYDQGGTNYQELKKITKWDGAQYVLVSRYALRYSILHWANKIYPDKWKLAGDDVLTVEKGGVARPKIHRECNKDFKTHMETILYDYPEFDLFGFMCAPKKESEEKESEVETFSRTSPVKISHAISLTPYNYDSHFMANLDVMRRAKGPGAGSNPVTIEEKKDFYVYNIVIDVDRIGKYPYEEHGQKINDTKVNIDVSSKRNDRIRELLETIFTLKREIKGRMEDLSPWLLICGLYENGKYETYADKIELAKSHVYKIITKEKETKDNDGRIIREIENEIVEKNAPKFVINIDTNVSPELTVENDKEKIVEEIKKFLEGKLSQSQPKSQSRILVYKRRFVETEPPFQSQSNSDPSGENKN